MKLLTFRSKSSLALSLLGLALAGGQAAQAQAALSLTTDTPTIPVGSVATFTVKLTGGTNLAGYNINVLIDPTKLQFVNTGTASAPVYYTSTNSSLLYLGSQVNTTTTASGVGPGGDLNFTGGDLSSFDNSGTSVLGTFQVKVLSSLPLTGSSISFGTLQAGAGFRGTGVLDPNNTNQATSATSASLTNPVPVSGTVSLQGASGLNLTQPLVFTITPTGATAATPGAGATQQTVTLSADTGSTAGAFTLAGVAPGTYTVGAKGARWLQQNLTLDTTAGAVTSLGFSLPGGDINGDNVINLLDYQALSTAYLSTPASANWNPLADLDFSGRVDLRDYQILSGNYRKRGDTTPTFP